MALTLLSLLIYNFQNVSEHSLVFILFLLSYVIAGTLVRVT